MVIHEAELNTAMAEVLDGMRRAWTVEAEQTGGVLGSGRPDIVVTEPGAAPVIIENE